MLQNHILVFLSAGFLAAVAGCSSSTNDRFVPTENRARQALDAALTAWQEGKRPGAIEGAPMSLQAVDSQWQKGGKLNEYEIVSQEPNDGPPLFTVKLTIEGVIQPTVVRYYVVGKDPLWVYREDDFNRSGGM